MRFRLILISLSVLISPTAFAQNITVKAGAHWIPHKFQGDPNIFDKATTLGYSFEAYAGFAWKKVNPFTVELGLARKAYSIGYKVKYEIGRSFTMATDVISVPARLVYTLRLRNSGWNFDGIGGLSLNANLEPYRAGGKEGTLKYTFESSEKSVAPVFPLVELGLRLNYTTRYRVTFKFGWSKHFGFVDILRNNMVYYHKDGTQAGTAIFKSKGNYREISFGISYSPRFWKKPKTE